MPERSPFFPPSIYCRYLRYCWVFHLNLMPMGPSRMGADSNMPLTILDRRASTTRPSHTANNETRLGGNGLPCTTESPRRLVPFSAPPKRGAVLWSNAPKTKGNSIGYRNGNESYQHDSINGPPRLETATVKNVVPVSGWLTPKRTGDSKHPLRRRLSF